MVCIFSETVTSQNPSGPVICDSIFVKGLSLAVIPRGWNYATVTFN